MAISENPHFAKTAFPEVAKNVNEGLHLERYLGYIIQ